MVMEYVPGGDLCEHLTALSNDHARALSLFSQVVDGLAHIHMHGIVHNDIKADNILLAADGTPKICDFGLACKIGHPLLGRGTSRYMAPELLTDDGDKIVGVPASPLHDVWSLGILLYAMLTDNLPWRRAVLGDQDFFAMQGNQLKVDGVDDFVQKVCLRPVRFYCWVLTSCSSYVACFVCSFRDFLLQRYGRASQHGLVRIERLK
jgi:serine/threonine-protein kinase